MLTEPLPSPRPTSLPRFLKLGDCVMAWRAARDPAWWLRVGYPETRIRERVALSEGLHDAAIRANLDHLLPMGFGILACVGLDGMPEGPIEQLAADAEVWLWAALRDRAHPDAPPILPESVRLIPVSSLFAQWPSAEEWAQQVAAARRARGGAV